jgi:hypothetical protein
MTNPRMMVPIEEAITTAIYDHRFAAEKTAGTTFAWHQIYLSALSGVIPEHWPRRQLRAQSPGSSQQSQPGW